MAHEITVLAGNGRSGRRVAAALRVAGHRVRVAGRRGPVRFDWFDDATWPAVLDGVDALYLVVPDEAPEVVPRFVEAAAAVPRVVLLSGRALERFAGSFGDALVAGERALAAHGGATVLRSSNFDQNFTEDIWAGGVRAGRLALPGAHIADAFVDLGDVAAVAARVLTEPGHEGRTYDLTGPDVLEAARAVEIIAAATGRDVRYEVLDAEGFAAELRADGADEARVRAETGLLTIMDQGVMAATSDDVARLLGRPPRAFADWAVEQSALGAWT